MDDNMNQNNNPDQNPKPNPNQNYNPNPNPNMGPGQGYNPNNFDPYPTPQGGKGMAIASLVLGIIATITSCCYLFVGIICGIVAVILGIISIKKNNLGKGMAIAGIILGGVGILLYIIWLVAATAIYDALPYEYRQYFDNYDYY